MGPAAMGGKANARNDWQGDRTHADRGRRACTEDRRGRRFLYREMC